MMMMMMMMKNTAYLSVNISNNCINQNYKDGLAPPITKTRLFKYIENFISKNWKFSDKKLFIFLLKTWIVGTRRGGSNEYPQSMFLSRNKKNNVYPCKPQFYYIKVGFKGVKII